jgi:phosphotransferase system enzyme I (PtsI)
LFEGVGASPGRVLGLVRRLEWEIPPVPHRTIGPEEVDREIERFEQARKKAIARVVELQAETTDLLGRFEGKVFESQALMIDDPDLIEGTIAYIRDNFLAAERAFELQVLEYRVRMLDSPHAMVLDRLPDLHDVRLGVLSSLLNRPEPSLEGPDAGPATILVARDIAPSLAVRMRPEHVLGIVTASGSRGSHSVLLARSLGIPAVVGVGAELARLTDGAKILIDGHTGRLIIDPTDAEEEGYRRAVVQKAAQRKILARLAADPTETVDGVHTIVQANLDQPFDVEEAIRLGAEGVGLFRSEFLVIGRREIPSEEEQYEAYTAVVEAFPGREVTLRTFDIGGDKFPLFLSMPPEENPYLGWRAIRVCLDLPELFRNQLRAAVRASTHGNLRLLIPFVTSADELARTRERLAEVYESLDMVESGRRIPVGLMVETPAAVETIDLLAPYADFVSLGSNDLTQYVLAADRGYAKVSGIYEPLHPALVRMYRRLAADCARHQLDLSVCGELAADPVGVAVLLGLGYRKFSVSLSALAEIRELIRHLSVAELEQLCEENNRCESGAEVRAVVEAYFERSGALTVGGTQADTSSDQARDNSLPHV